MKFMFMTRQGARITECTEFEAHELLREYAADHGLRVDAHRGGWEGNALSVAYQPDGDSLLHCEAVVRPQRCTHAQLLALVAPVEVTK